MSLFIASSFSLSLLESSCFPMFFTFSSGLSRKAEPEPRAIARSLVCSENVSCNRIPSLDAFSASMLRFTAAMMVCRVSQGGTAREMGVESRARRARPSLERP